MHLSDMAGELARGRVHIDLKRVSWISRCGRGEHGGPASAGPVGVLTITGISCQTGPGTMYELRASMSHYRKYAFFQLIQEDRDNTASDDVEFWVKPGDVKDIHAPTLREPAIHRSDDAQPRATMIVDKP